MDFTQEEATFFLRGLRKSGREAEFKSVFEELIVKYPWELSFIAETKIRPHYYIGILLAALQAKAIGINAITAIEFGVAQGHGLRNMEICAELVEKIVGISIDVIGVDTGVGMPEAVDYRDAPFQWKAGSYKMDKDELQKILKRAKILIFDIRTTLLPLQSALKSHIGFCSFDLDYYSSTASALSIFKLTPDSRIPRTICYFDDVLSDFCFFSCDYIGELAAIKDFNESNPRIKIAKINGMKHMFPFLGSSKYPFVEQFYVCHDFHHPHYNTFARLDIPGGTTEPLSDGF
ncbi:MAG: hypothetical protein HQL40_00220 [Alphaproteobacteria bacterium]|nr:hypothetical protein [Alphaproteobacteria bacterium]MBF0332056.1 hypothetical protein [Alphaproteobacteria bacterium]